jgi:hypothetical protein
MCVTNTMSPNMSIVLQLYSSVHFSAGFRKYNLGGSELTICVVIETKYVLNLHKMRNHLCLHHTWTDITDDHIWSCI